MDVRASHQSVCNTEPGFAHRPTVLVHTPTDGARNRWRNLLSPIGSSKSPVAARKNFVFLFTKIANLHPRARHDTRQARTPRRSVSEAQQSQSTLMMYVL